MLGLRQDAEDIVQEAYLRWHNADQDLIDKPEAWLVTTTSRLAIDRLRRLKTERESYIGQWLPQPIVTEGLAPDRRLDLADDLSMAFLTLLERLAPDGRAAFLLHEVFDVGYAGIASVLEPLLSDTHVPDEIYQRVAEQFGESELVALTFGVIVINAWNRLSVSFRAPAGTYQPRAARRPNAHSAPESEAQEHLV